MLCEDKYLFCWPDFMSAKEVIDRYKKEFISLPPEENEKEFKRSCDRFWAVEDILSYMKEFWFYDKPEEIIADYIDEARFRSEKYKDHPMGPAYKIAKETAEDVY